jgi:UDP-N-acetylmuramate--alanine ligase
MKSDKLKIFFSGIGGSGVSAIAGFMADKGHVVTGSDRAFDLNPAHPLKKTFQSKGISIVPQDGGAPDGSYDLAVFSTAVEPDRPEVLKAKETGVQVQTRPVFLAELTESFKTIAVSGTSGKSTVSGMLAFLMHRMNLSPNLIGGGRVRQFRTEADAGNYLVGNSEYLIIEACESDGSIVNYKPEHTIILNLDFDHHTVEDTKSMFEILISRTKGKVIVNADDDNLAGIPIKDAVTFSVFKSSDYRAEEIILNKFSSTFSVRGTAFTVSIPGMHNVYNALSCIAFLSELGMSPDAIAELLPEFQGIDRRFDIHLDDDNYLVVDDYAHNPHKLAALMETMKQLRESVCYIFQPHGFGPTRMMKKEYIETFVLNLRDSDHLVLLPIFYAGGTAGRDISSDDLADGIAAAGKSVEVIENRRDIVDNAGEYKCYVILGARDDTLADLAEEVAVKLLQAVREMSS